MYENYFLPELKGVLLSPNEGCGYTKVAHKRIVGGTAAKVGAWSWMVLVLYTNKTGTFSNCGKIFLYQICIKSMITLAFFIFNSSRRFFDYYQVWAINLIRYAKTNTNSIVLFSIWSCRHVLTAAHCYRKDLYVWNLRFRHSNTAFNLLN